MVELPEILVGAASVVLAVAVVRWDMGRHALASRRRRVDRWLPEGRGL